MSQIPYVEVDTFLKPLGQGVSNPVLIIASDSNKYILKTQFVEINGGRLHYNCLFFNELLTYKIARYLDVPIPPCAIVRVDKDHLNHGPELRFVYRFTEGLHFASKEIEGNENNLLDGYLNLIKMNKPYIKRSWNAFFDRIQNGSKIARIIAMDLLIANFDRFVNEGNLLVASGTNGRMVYAIDHGHAFFGPIWDTRKISELRKVNSPNYIHYHTTQLLNLGMRTGLFAGFGEIFKAIEGYVDLTDPDNHSFIDVVERIESIDEPLLDSWFEEIPDEWYVDKKSQIAEHKNYILRQKDYIRFFVQHLASNRAFSNYRGGVLKWNDRRVGTV